MRGGRPRWTSLSTCSTACWTWDARTPSASPEHVGAGVSAAAPLIPAPRWLTAKRDLDAAKRFFRKMLQEEPLLSPDRIGTDGAGAYPPAIAAARNEGLLARTPVHYVTK